MNIKDYDIVCESNISFFRRKVGERLEDGWELYGTPFSSDGMLCQAIVFYKGYCEE